MSAILEVQDLNVYYGVIHALKGISFHVNKGEIVTLIGANGAGKTTTLQTITGLIPSRSGSIVIALVASRPSITGILISIKIIA